MNRLRVFILTECDCAMASRCLPKLVSTVGVEVAGVVLVDAAKRKLSRILQKMLKIGFLGAVNGIRMRKWYGDEEPGLNDLCLEYGIPFHANLRQNSEELRDLLHSFDADLGLSLGNGFISPKTFMIPKFGMINVHSEILPRYQNAQCIIWPIYWDDPYTGFTIHEIERKIDAGRILYQKKIPIQFEKTLELTVRNNRKIVEAMVPGALADVCANFESYSSNAVKQEAGSSFTTPSIGQYMRMVRNNRKRYVETH